MYINYWLYLCLIFFVKKSIVNRGEWTRNRLLDIAYHDEEWGVPVHDDKKLFEFVSVLKLAVISTISAVSAVIIIFFFSNYASLFFAYDFDIPASFNLSGIKFTDSIENLDWSRDAMITILLSKPISAFFLGMVFLIILMLGTQKSVTTIFALFWLNVFAFNSAFGALIDDAISGVGTYEVATAMNLGNNYLIIMSIILSFILFKIGMMNGKLMIISFPNQNLFSFKSRLIFFIFVFIIPWLTVIIYTYLSAGSVFSTSEMLKIIPGIILLIPFLTTKKLENSKFHYLPAKHLSVIDIILMGILIMGSVILIIVMKDGITIA